MPSFLANYDPSAFHAGLQWAAQQESDRQQKIARQQQQKDELERQQQAYDLQLRNNAAEAAQRFAMEAARTKAQLPVQWRTDTANKSLAAAQETITAKWNTAQAYDTAARAEPSNFDPAYVKANKAYMKSLETAQQQAIVSVNKLDPTQDSPVWSSPNLGGAIPDVSDPPAPVYSQTYLDQQAAEQKNAADKEKLDLDYKRSEIAGKGETARHNRAMESVASGGLQLRQQKEARRSLNPVIKLTPEQHNIAKLGNYALGQGALWHQLSDGDPRKEKAAQAYQDYYPYLTKGLADPAIARTYGLSPNTSAMLSAGINAGKIDLSHPGKAIRFINQSVGAASNRDTPGWEPEDATKANEIRGMFLSSPYVEPEPESAPATGGDE